ncbi:MAG: hypothetical protein ABIK08_04085 [Pseudomonadota bacterium]
MALYRATPKLINRIMTGRVPARAFVVGIGDNGTPIDGAIPGSPGVTGHIAGLEFKDLIDPSTGSFSMPAALAPVSESLPHPHTGVQPTVRCDIQADKIGAPGSCPLTGQIFMNRYFEADFPSGTAAGWINHLVQNGWFAAAGDLTNASVPAAHNVKLPALTRLTGSRAGVY